MALPKLLADMRRDDSCPEDAHDFACWACLDRSRTCPECGPEYDKDEGWSRAQDDEMYRDSDR